MGWSPQIHAGFHGSGVTWELDQRSNTFRVRGRYPLWRDFPDASTTQQLCNSVRGLRSLYQVPQPRTGNAVGLSHQFGLGCSAFARRY